MLILNEIQASQGIFEGLEKKRTLKEILELMTEYNYCVTLDCFDSLKISKIYNNFGYHVYNTRETIDKFCRVTESQQVLVFDEVVSEEDYDECIDATNVKFEIELNDIQEDGIEFTEFEQMLKIYLNNNMVIRLHYV